MNDEQAFFKQSASDVVNSFLNYVDAFTVTANLIQFLIWFTVGLFVLSAIRTGVQFYQELQDDITIATKYIHQHQFTTRAFVRKVILAFAMRYGYLVFHTVIVISGLVIDFSAQRFTITAELTINEPQCGFEVIGGVANTACLCLSVRYQS